MTQLGAEADLIRKAVDACVAQPQADVVKPIPPDEAAWQEILASFAVMRDCTLPGAPYRWTREDYDDDPRYR